MVEHTMDVSGWLRKQLEETSPDLLQHEIELMHPTGYARIKIPRLTGRDRYRCPRR